MNVKIHHSLILYYIYFGNLMKNRNCSKWIEIQSNQVELCSCAIHENALNEDLNGAENWHEIISKHILLQHIAWLDIFQLIYSIVILQFTTHYIEPKNCDLMRTMQFIAFQQIEMIFMGWRSTNNQIWFEKPWPVFSFRKYTSNVSSFDKCHRCE